MNEHTRPPAMAGADAERGPQVRSRLTPAITLLFAAACGLSVANIYFAQPLLDAMARDFAVDPASIGTVVTLTQLGYALGLVFLVPLGDLLNRRLLVAVQATLSAIALVAAGLAPSYVVFLAGMVAVGFLAVVVQTIVAFAATLAERSEQGRAVGVVTSGVVTGILLARFASGVIADLGGWRAVYLSSAVLTGLLSILLVRTLPDEPQRQVPQSYRQLLSSMLALFLEEPQLRVRALLALLIFAAFSTLWTAMVLPLSAPPLSLSSTEVGLFGLAGLFGALAAGGTGRLVDKGYGQRVTAAALLLLTFSWLPIGMLDRSLLALVAGIVLLDLAVQAVHVSNQSLIFALRPEARSRLVGGYMVFYSLGSGAGALASTLIYAKGGWGAVCLLGAAISLAALVLWAATLPRR